MGRVSRDLVLRYTSTGEPVINVGMAITRRTMKSGQREERTAFVDVAFFGEKAELLVGRLRKCDLFYCVGEIDQIDRITNEGTDRERKERKTTVIGVSFQLLPNGPRGGKHDPAPIPE